jgi:hypothetical protein
VSVPLNGVYIEYTAEVDSGSTAVAMIVLCTKVASAKSDRPRILTSV